VRGRAGPGEAVQFGSDGGGLGCAGPVEDFPCLAHVLSATAALVWNGDLPRPLQQILFQTADAITPELAAIGLLAAAVGSRRKFGID
jgi:crotonobetainyl-CoA:carnitine CoA-transferase CaiB-like acyl-CoA transferase